MARGLIKTLGLAGAALTAWYFLDPKKGAQRRDSFVKNAKDLYDTAGEELGRLSKTAGEEIGRISKTAGDELSRVGKDLASTVTDTVTRAGDVVHGLTGSKTNGASETASQRSESLSAPTAVK